MFKKNIIFILVMFFVFNLMLTGYSQDTIKIGALGPLTGESSIAGLDELRGKQMAIDDLNAEGGILGKKIELFSEDDASQPSQSASAAMKLIYENGVIGIIGAHNSPCTLAVMEVLSGQKIPMVVPGSSSPKITSIGNKWIARSFPPDSIQAKGLASYAINTMGEKNFGIIYVNDDYGVGGYDVVREALEEWDEKLVGNVSFMGEDKDMRTPLTKLKANNVETLFIWCHYLPSSLIMRQAREMDWNVPFYTGTGNVHQKMFELAGDAFEGTHQVAGFLPNDPDPRIQEWIKRYKDKFGQDPSPNSARAYDGALILLKALEKAGTTDPEVWMDAIRNTKDLQGIQGKITIEPTTGEYIGELTLVKVENGEWKFITKIVPE